jgi:hypothetical protein
MMGLTIDSVCDFRLIIDSIYSHSFNKTATSLAK